MKYLLKSIVLLLALTSLNLQAFETVITERFFYGDADSKITARKMLLDEIKAKAVNQAGEYIQSESTYSSTSGEYTQEIKTLSASIIKIFVLEEEVKHENGRTFLQIKAKALVDEDVIKPQIKAFLESNEKLYLLRKLQRQNNILLSRLEKLREEARNKENINVSENNTKLALAEYNKAQAEINELKNKEYSELSSQYGLNNKKIKGAFEDEINLEVRTAIDALKMIEQEKQKQADQKQAEILAKEARIALDAKLRAAFKIKRDAMEAARDIRLAGLVKKRNELSLSAKQSPLSRKELWHLLADPKKDNFRKVTTDGVTYLLYDYSFNTITDETVDKYIPSKLRGSRGHFSKGMFLANDFNYPSYKEQEALYPNPDHTKEGLEILEDELYNNIEFLRYHHCEPLEYDVAKKISYKDLRNEFIKSPIYRKENTPKVRFYEADRYFEKIISKRLEKHRSIFHPSDFGQKQYDDQLKYIRDKSRKKLFAFDSVFNALEDHVEGWLDQEHPIRYFPQFVCEQDHARHYIETDTGLAHDSFPESFWYNTPSHLPPQKSKRLTVTVRVDVGLKARMEIEEEKNNNKKGL